jgi:hypothetical protein
VRAHHDKCLTQALARKKDTFLASSFKLVTGTSCRLHAIFHAPQPII